MFERDLRMLLSGLEMNGPCWYLFMWHWIKSRLEKVDLGQLHPQVGPVRCSWPLTHTYSRTHSTHTHTCMCTKKHTPSLKCTTSKRLKDAQTHLGALIYDTSSTYRCDTMHAASKLSCACQHTHTHTYLSTWKHAYWHCHIWHANSNALMVISQSNICRSALNSPHVCDHLRSAWSLFTQGVLVQSVSGHV